MGTGKENKLKYTENISFTDARKGLQPPSSDPSKNSYATVTKTPQQRPKTSAALGQKHPTSNRFSNWGSIFEIYIKLLF